jgi:hypothetical protein
MPVIFTIRVNLSVNTVRVDKTWRYNVDKTVQEVNILGAPTGYYRSTKFRIHRIYL